jgi:hypothetical protein
MKIFFSVSYTMSDIQLNYFSTAIPINKTKNKKKKIQEK